MPSGSARANRRHPAAGGAGGPQELGHNPQYEGHLVIDVQFPVETLNVGVHGPLRDPQPGSDGRLSAAIKQTANNLEFAP